jgi:integrase
LRDPNNTRRDLREAFLAMGMPGLTSHAFRKTVATLMDEAGLSARSAADQLGHAKPSVTQDVYFGRNRRATGAAQVLEQLA